MSESHKIIPLSEDLEENPGLLESFIGLPNSLGELNNSVSQKIFDIFEQDDLKISDKGNLEKSDEVNFDFPEYIEINEQGVYLDLQKISNTTEFQSFLNIFFKSGYYFVDLDIEKILSLSYEDVLYLNNSEVLKIKIAKKPSKFNKERSFLYKSLKINRGEAQFTFDKSFLNYRDNTLENHSLDELFAYLWNGDVKYGFCLEEISNAVKCNETKKIIVAKPNNPIAGEDAKIVETSEAMRIDLTPTELQNGRIDYKKLKNIIPQTEVGETIYKKVPLVNPKDGRDIFGKVLTLPAPKDLDISKFCGEGTSVSLIDDQEYIISNKKGYLFYDSKVKKVYINEVLILNNDINKSTGDLEILGGNFRLVGNIQPGFSLNGNNIEIEGGVNGGIISQSGNININGNIHGAGKKSSKKYGYIENKSGDILVSGKLIHNSSLNSPNGMVNLNKVGLIEKSRIIGGTVEINKAVNSIILGNNIKAKSLTNCIVIGKNIEIGEIVKGSVSFGSNVVLCITENVESNIYLKDLISLKNEKENFLSELQSKIKLFQKFLEPYNGTIDYTDQKKFNEYLQPYLKKSNNIKTKLKDKSFVSSLNNSQKQKISNYIGLVKKLTEYNYLLNKIPEVADEIIALDSEISILEHDKLKKEKESHCIISKICSNLNVKKLSISPEASITNLDVDEIIAELRNNIEFEVLYSSDGNGENYKFSL